MGGYLYSLSVSSAAHSIPVFGHSIPVFGYDRIRRLIAAGLLATSHRWAGCGRGDWAMEVSRYILFNTAVAAPSLDSLCAALGRVPHPHVRVVPYYLVVRLQERIGADKIVQRNQMDLVLDRCELHEARQIAWVVPLHIADHHLDTGEPRYVNQFVGFFLRHVSPLVNTCYRLQASGKWFRIRPLPMIEIPLP